MLLKWINGDVVSVSVKRSWCRTQSIEIKLILLSCYTSQMSHLQVWISSMRCLLNTKDDDFPSQIFIMKLCNRWLLKWRNPEGRFWAFLKVWMKIVDHKALYEKSISDGEHLNHTFISESCDIINMLECC